MRTLLLILLSAPIVRPQMVEIAIASTPSGAGVQIDSVLAGRTPTSFKLQPGEYKINLTMAGFEAWDQKIVVRPGEPNTIAAEMRKRSEANSPEKKPPAISSIPVVSTTGNTPSAKSPEVEQHAFASRFEEFPCRSGKFMVQVVNVIQQIPMTLQSDLIGVFDITVRLRNETGEDWSNVSLNVDIFEPDGTQLGTGIVPHTFIIDTSIRAGEDKIFTINRARKIFRPVTIATFHVSLAPEAAQSNVVNPGTSVGFLAADTKCADEFHQAQQTAGLELRKRFADLLIYKCGQAFDAPVHAFVRSRQSSYAEIQILEGEVRGKVGWVPKAWLK